MHKIVINVWFARIKFNNDKWIKDHNIRRHKDHDYACGKCHNAFETKVELKERKLNDTHGVNN